MACDNYLQCLQILFLSNYQYIEKKKLIIWKSELPQSSLSVFDYINQY